MKTMCYRCMSNTGENGFCTVCGAPIRTQRDIGDDYLLPLGTRLDEGKIIVGEKLGRGGFGITYVALDTSQFGVIALKEFVPSFMINSMRINNSIYIDEQQREQYQKHMGFFQSEAITISKLNHPNIVRVYFEFEENNTCYYGMELLKGMNLYDWVARRGVLSAKDALTLISPILDALQFIHSRNVLHRDISPANIFMRDAPGKFMDVDPCLIDFGAAYDAQVAFSKSAPHIKTRGFSPPEQNAGPEHYGQFSDVYAIAAVLYYLVTNHMPTPSEDRFLRGVRIPEPCALNGSIPKAFSDAIMRGMTLDSANRTQTVQALRRELQNTLSGRAGRGTPSRGRLNEPVVTPAINMRPVTTDGKANGPAKQPPQVSGQLRDENGPRSGLDSGLLRSFLGSAVDTAIFAGLWTLVMSVKSLSNIVEDNVWIGGIAVFIVSVVCNVISCVKAGGTLGECLAQAPRQQMDSGKAATHALLHTIYPYALFSKLARLFAGGSGAEGTVAHPEVRPDDEGESLRSDLKRTDEAWIEPVNPGDRRICIQRKALSRGGQVLGRKSVSGTSCDVVVSDSMCVSRRHCRIAFDGDCYIEDVDSKNGTFVNGAPVSAGKRMPLRDGSKISLGEEGVELYFRQR